ncbi:hypothetical protein [Nitrincola schmidtii]|uniref:hypothetical protein n=1 Tax=Nitrincola schmidtii TaxID=1730894 RepID=UPI00124BD072|nr:hypothetical protein [Nitrincola schmidtii]
MSSFSALQQLEQQQTYLQAMGIQRWLPRQVLTHAPASAAWVAEFVWPPKEVVDVDQPSVDESSMTASVNPQTNIIDRPPRTLNTDAIQSSRQAALSNMVIDEPSVSFPAKAAPVSDTAVIVDESSAVEEVPLPERFKNPRYSLAFIPAGDLLVIDSLPPHARDAINPAYKKLLIGVCRSIGAEVNLEAIDTHLWPAFAGSHLNQGGEEAQNSVRRQLAVALKTHPIKRILLLGEPAAQWLLEQDQSLEAMRGLTFSLRSGVKTQVSYSLMHMLKLPEFKADCWRDLQALL